MDELIRGEHDPASNTHLDDRSRVIAAAFLAACRDELDAPKPGNVHVFAAGHGWSVADFVASAEAAAPAIAQRGIPVGERILAAVRATKAAVSHNSNLGILLLCTPLAAAAQRPAVDLRGSLEAVLAGLDTGDAAAAFQAIALAQPGGLGRAARHDVEGPATVGLLEAMAEAAQRDRIAWQYANGFGDVFDLGLETLATAQCRRQEPVLRTLAVFLAFMTAFPDSHIARKQGVACAEAVRREALPFAGHVADAARLSDVLPGLLRFDSDLKRRGLNPGTTADMTVATIFAFRLMNALSQPPINA